MCMRQAYKGEKKESELRATWQSENTTDRLETMFSHIHTPPLLAFSLHKTLSSANPPKKSDSETTAASSPILNGCWLCG